MRFRKKPVEIEAVRWTGDNMSELKEFAPGLVETHEREARDDNLTAEVWDYLHDTWVGIKTGQWVIRGTEGEFYPCEDDGTGTAPINYERIDQ
jgi:hypothetical protein